VNASAPAIAREVEVQSKIQKVSTFSRYARIVCSAFYGFGLVGIVALTLFGVMGLVFPGRLTDSGFTPAQKVASIPIAILFAGVWLAVVYQLYRLFGNLATRAIYTAENVRRVRNVGLLCLVLAVLGVLVPIAWAVLVRTGLLEPSLPSKFDLWFSWSESLSSFITAGLILLVSWIMDVGLYEKDHADALQRDADLVI